MSWYNPSHPCSNPPLSWSHATSSVERGNQVDRSPIPIEVSQLLTYLKPQYPWLPRRPNAMPIPGPRMAGSPRDLEAPAWSNEPWARTESLMPASPGPSLPTTQRPEGATTRKRIESLAKTWRLPAAGLWQWQSRARMPSGTQRRQRGSTIWAISIRRWQRSFGLDQRLAYRTYASCNDGPETLRKGVGMDAYLLSTKLDTNSLGRVLRVTLWRIRQPVVWASRRSLITKTVIMNIAIIPRDGLT